MVATTRSEVSYRVSNLLLSEGRRTRDPEVSKSTISNRDGVEFEKVLELKYIQNDRSSTLSLSGYTRLFHTAL